MKSPDPCPSWRKRRPHFIQQEPEAAGRWALPLLVLTARPGKAGGPLQLDLSVRPTGWRREKGQQGSGPFPQCPLLPGRLCRPLLPPGPLFDEVQAGLGNGDAGRWFPALSQPSPAPWRLETGPLRVERGPLIQSLPCPRFLGTAGPGEGVPGRPQGWLSPAGPVTLAVTRGRRGD